MKSKKNIKLDKKVFEMEITEPDYYHSTIKHTY